MTENQVLGMVRDYGSMDEAIAKMPEISLELNDGTTYSEKERLNLSVE